MIREHKKCQPDPRRGRGDRVRVAQAVGSVRVDVNNAGNGAVAERNERKALRGRGEEEHDADGGREDRRQQQKPLQIPARDFSAAALSVRSQVNSGSVRPKWPNAAVFL